MYLFSNLSDIAENQVKKYGAQYHAFAIFGLINYPTSYLYKLSVNANQEELYLRIISIILCFLLLIKDKWPKTLKKYLPIYWYVTLTFTLPILATFMLLIENFSLNWLINFNLGIMTLIFLLDSITFLFITSLGIILGTILFYILGNSIQHLPSHEDISLFIYMFLCIVVIGTIFTRNKEIFNHCIQKAKDDLNESLEQKVKERTKELEKALTAKTEFLNNMSHEMRTPVSGFTAISEGLVEHWDILNNEKKLKYAKDISNSAQRLGSLISNLLDLSTFITNKMDMNFIRVDFNNLIERIIDETKTLYANEKIININYIPVEDAFVAVDRDWIMQALRHLFSNAIKFNTDDGFITVNLSKLDDSLHFSIADAGVGIPQSEMKDIFIPFTQSSRTKTKAGGRGLGLAICKEIIEAHNGKIWAENNIKHGATFHFSLPTKL